MQRPWSALEARLWYDFGLAGGGGVPIRFSAPGTRAPHRHVHSHGFPYSFFPPGERATQRCELEGATGSSRCSDAREGGCKGYSSAGQAARSGVQVLPLPLLPLLLLLLLLLWG